MAAAYRFLRGLEHRLQMLDDEQTHSLPSKPEKFEQVAHFCSYADGRALAAASAAVESCSCIAASRDVPPCRGGRGSIVFTATRRRQDQTLPRWARQPIVAIRRARLAFRPYRPCAPPAPGRLTDSSPRLERCAEAQPDLALETSTVPRRIVRLAAFAMLRNNPGLLEMLADIMGTAPRLARLVSRRPRLLDAILDPGFLGKLPAPEELTRIVRARLDQSRSYEEALDTARMVGQEQSLLIGVGVLSGSVGADAAAAPMPRSR